MTGCTKPYVCVTDEQCVQHGVQGLCAPQGYCGFPDQACDSGFRFESGAGDGLGGKCVELPPSCGGVGEACCPNEIACNSNAFCSNGTCEQCVTDVGLGHHFSCLVKHDHTVWCAGENASGELGIGMVTVVRTERLQVIDANGPITDATAVTAGREHACALRAGGSVWCWGLNNQGQLGNGVPLTPAPQPSSVAVQVVQANMMPLTGMVTVRSGETHTCALDAAGALWCWGSNFNGQLGDGTTMARSTSAQVMLA